MPRIESRLRLRLEHYVMQCFAAGRSLRQISGCLGVSQDTIRRYLRRRGYRINQHCQLVRIDPDEQGGGRQAGP